MNKIIIWFLAIFNAMQISSHSAVIYYSVNNYSGRRDNPFLDNSALGVVYLEDFEAQDSMHSNILTTPYATGWNGSALGSVTGGVSEDHPTEGSIGWRWSDSSKHQSSSKLPEGIHFDFALDAYGRLPEYVGAALLGKIDQFDVGGLYNSILVYDKNGNEITDGLWKLPRPLFSEDKLEDHFQDFEGIYVPGGISRIQFRDFSEIDHLTYGYAPIPEPGALGLADVAAASLLRRRSRKRTV